ncbi:MAG: squalene synthase HpnC [bacterium]
MSRPLSVETEAAYRACERLARSHYENFAVASFLLPPGVRRHMAALYGFARGVDDIGDEYEGDRLAALDRWEAHLRGLYGEEERPGGPRPAVFLALGATIRACGLPMEPFLRLIEANRMDQRVSRYRGWEDLLEYCTFSADPVGRLVLRIFGCTDSSLHPLSDATCTALQLTNFWQDVGRDHEMGRIYLPREDMERFGVPEADLGGRPASRAFRDLIRFEVERTRPFFERGRELVGRVEGRFRVDLALFSRGGEAILDAIEGLDYDVLTRRPVLSRGRKLTLLADTLLRHLFGGLP